MEEVQQIIAGSTCFAFFKDTGGIMKNVFLAAVLAAGLATQANAAIVDVSFSGVLTLGSSPYEPGSTFSGVYAYDTNAPLIFSVGNEKYYQGLGNLKYTVNGQTTIANISQYGIRLVDEPTYNYFGVLVSLSGFPGIADMMFGLTDLGNATISSTALPTIFPTTNGNFFVYNPGGFNGISYSVTSALTVRSAVPELAVWAMLLTGFGMSGAVIRRRRVKSLAAVGRPYSAIHEATFVAAS
jgi:hypothetical protein